MPTSPEALFREADLNISGCTAWNVPPNNPRPGVYVVSLPSTGIANTGFLPHAPISVALVREWIGRVPAFTFQGQQFPRAELVAEFIQRFWLPDECIVYIGKATSLRRRLGEFFRHRLGDRMPHKGGHWLKTLTNIHHLSVFYAECLSEPEAIQKETQLLQLFSRQTSAASKSALFNPDCPLPFANLKISRQRKQNCIRNCVLPKIVW